MTLLVGGWTVKSMNTALSRLEAMLNQRAPALAAALAPGRPAEELAAWRGPDGAPLPGEALALYAWRDGGRTPAARQALPTLLPGLHLLSFAHAARLRSGLGFVRLSMPWFPVAWDDYGSSTLMAVQPPERARLRVLDPELFAGPGAMGPTFGSLTELVRIAAEGWEVGLLALGQDGGLRHGPGLLDLLPSGAGWADYAETLRTGEADSCDPTLG